MDDEIKEENSIIVGIGRCEGGIVMNLIRSEKFEVRFYRNCAIVRV